MPHIKRHRVVTSGTFELDGGSWEVDNNVWLVGDDNDVVVFDAAHTAAPIVAAVAGRNVVAVVCTHGHNDHVTVAPELGKALDAPVLLHPADDMLWRMTHPDETFASIDDGRAQGRHSNCARCTPRGTRPARSAGMPPNSARSSAATPCSHGGPGATGRSFSDFPTILESISGRLGKLPGRHRRLHRPRRHHHRR